MSKHQDSTSAIILSVSYKHDKKYMVTIGNKTIHFGANGYEDYTRHKDQSRMKLYIQRHQKREDWTLGGMYTPGFWSRWLLWNKPSLGASIQDIKRKFGLKILKNV